MKTTKILAVVLGLFLMGNVNVALAQDENTERKDSIYGLEASVENGFLNFSFYSTYEMAKMWNIGIDLYYGENGEKVWNMQSNRLWTSDPLEVQFSERFGTVSYETIDGVSKINLSNANLLNISSLKKVEIYIEGEDVMPLSLDKYPVKTGKSNVLSFFFDPLSTSLKETVNDGNYVYNYFFLSGVESKTKPVGVPFIQKKYHNGILISTDKRIGVR